MSRRDQDPFHDAYGTKSKKQLERGDDKYYSKEKKYRDDSYRQDRINQVDRYNRNAETFKNATTKNTRDDYQQYYSRPGDDPALKKYLRTERTGLFDPPSRREAGDPERVAATQDNRHADQVRHSNRVATEDFGYKEDSFLRRDYKTAKNDRDRR